MNDSKHTSNPDAPFAPCPGWTAAQERILRRRDYWRQKKLEAMESQNMLYAAGFECRAAGLDDALKIMFGIEEEQQSNDQAQRPLP